MATNGFKIKNSANLDPQSGSVVTTKGDVAYNSGTDKLELYNGAADPIVTEAKAATLTNKTITGAGNTISGITVASTVGIYAGKQTISSSATSQAVTFSTAFGSTSYAVTCTLLNVTDTNPEFQPLTITAQATTGFTASWNYPLATSNYVLSWIAVINN